MKHRWVLVFMALACVLLGGCRSTDAPPAATPPAVVVAPPLVMRLTEWDDTPAASRRPIAWTFAPASTGISTPSISATGRSSNPVICCSSSIRDLYEAVYVRVESTLVEGWLYDGDGAPGAHAPDRRGRARAAGPGHRRRQEDAWAGGGGAGDQLLRSRSGWVLAPPVSDGARRHQLRGGFGEHRSRSAGSADDRSTPVGLFWTHVGAKFSPRFF